VAIDVGANVGAYTLRMSQLVGPSGRVYAFEPVPGTFASLTRNVNAVGATNVTLFNAACGEETGLVGMSVPDDSDGLPNPYLAHISKTPMSLNALCLQIDALQLRDRIALVKIDAEGFDAQVVFGMRTLLANSHPRIIIESRDSRVEATLAELGYELLDDPKSPNAIFEVAPSKPNPRQPTSA
jgi:FkbM family methyltransferase